jgi:hypothetical protein
LTLARASRRVGFQSSQARGLDVRSPAVVWRLVLVALPLVLVTLVLLGAARSGVIGFDFRGTLWDPGEAIVHGRSPYPPPHPAALRTGNPAVYPPAVMLLVSPLSLLPWSAAIAVWIALSTVAVAVGLRLLSVSDWRVYAVTFASNAYLSGASSGNLALLLFLGVAVAWRWRNRPVVAGAAVAAVIVGKVFLWPLLVWLLATRRFRAATYAIGVAAVATVGSWAVIGFSRFGDYPRLLRALDDVYSSHSLSVTALGAAAGLGRVAAHVVALAAALALLGSAAWRREGRDRSVFCAAVIAGIVATPIVWIYYFVLLLAPLALHRRSLAWTWWLVAGPWLLALLARETAPALPCCKPRGMPKDVWAVLSTKPSTAVLIGTAVFLALTAYVTIRGASAEALGEAHVTLEVVD